MVYTIPSYIELQKKVIKKLNFVEEVKVTVLIRDDYYIYTTSSILFIDSIHFFILNYFYKKLKKLLLKN